ncbi:MAG: hypothetical protein IPO56_10415 [Flavobacteriales bacterium]|nr:hypothetical protein [Flavobacteriales bacterium]
MDGLRGLANGNDFPGQPCDDGIVGNNATYWSTACTCADYYDCNGVVNGPLVAGSPCLYSNALDGTPIYGVRDENCQCSWTDCEGLANGNDFPGQPCDDGIVGNNATYWSTACTCADYYDCNGGSERAVGRWITMPVFQCARWNAYLWRSR